MFAPAPRVRRTWEALGAADVPFSLEDGSQGWLALADPDQLDQALWAILDNAVGHGGRTAIEVTIGVDLPAGDLAVTIADHGPGVPDDDRERLFGRFERGAQRPAGEGRLGLCVSRELCRHERRSRAGARGTGRGAALTNHLPGRPP